MAKEILLTRGKVALVDDADYELVKAYKWQAFNPGKCWYAKARIGGREQSLHRYITGAPDGTLVDHRDGDGLNCVRSNLRLADRSQNSANTGKRDQPTRSKYKGVRWAERGQRWHAYLKKNYRQIFLGSYATEEEAARAYDAGAILYFGEFARLNFDRR